MTNSIAKNPVQINHSESGQVPTLQISNLDVYYGESHILRNVDLSVLPGQMVCLIGRNGVGKTTLLKTVIGLLNARRGSVNLKGKEINALTPDRRAKLGIGYVPQGREIIPRLTVKENLFLGMEALSPAKRKNKGAIAAMSDLVYELFPVIKEMLPRMGGDLSGGQQQQLAIGRALMGQPDLLLLDEPTEGIQPSIILEIEAAVKQIAAAGTSVLLVEQHLHFVRQADWYYAMQKGGIVSSGVTADLSNEVIQHFLAV
jgi:urea transport system ATP-binding protein